MGNGDGVGGLSSTSHGRWIIGIVSFGLVSGFWFLLIQDRAGFDRRLTAVELLALETRQTQIGVVVKLDNRVEELQRSMDRIESELVVIKSRQRK